MTIIQDAYDSGFTFGIAGLPLGDDGSGEVDVGFHVMLHHPDAEIGAVEYSYDLAVAKLRDLIVHHYPTSDFAKKHGGERGSPSLQ